MDDIEEHKYWFYNILGSQASPRQMSSFFSLSFSLLKTAKSALLQIWLKVQVHGILSTSAIVGLVVLYAARYFTSPYRKLPPGPRGYPIIGNLLELGRGKWLKFSEWQRKYGDLIYLNVAGQSIVVLNSQRIAEDLLDRRARIYSDRPRLIVACDMMTDGLLFGFAKNNDTWRRMRKAAAEGLSKNAVKEFYETHVKEAVLLASDLLLDPTEWNAHLLRSAGSMILSVLYGYPTITSKQDRVLEAIDDFSTRLFRAALPGAHFVEFFPWLRYVPSRFARRKREVEASYKKDTDLFKGLVKTVETDLAKGGDNQSLSATLIREVERNKLSSKERSWVAGTLYTGNADTSPRIMGWWMLAMLVYPETQARAQSELDKIVGRARLPTFADYPHLPYIRAMVKEILRWGPVVPLAAPHVSIEDDCYEGMFIPNVWHMNRDPEIYGEDAALFDPARYLRPQGPSRRRSWGHRRVRVDARPCHRHRHGSGWGAGPRLVWIRPQAVRRAPRGQQLAFHRHRGRPVGGEDRAQERRVVGRGASLGRGRL
ncbi:cytochrome P450 [Russula dissimulans]|nr:cytochrome P450 [Russula dissimulans]